MIRIWTIIVTGLFSLSLTACLSPGAAGQRPIPPQTRPGQYVYPRYQRPQPRAFTPQDDQCGARLYQGLVGQHIGGIHLAGIGGDKRIVKPAELETTQDDFLPDMNAQPPRVEVREMLAGQPLYAASVRTGLYRNQLGLERADRLTIELDRAGYITRASCA